MAFDPFAGYMALARPRLPGSMGDFDTVVMAAIILFSFAAWAIPVVSWFLRSVRAGALRFEGSIGRLGGSPVQLTQVVALALGTAVAVLLVETGANVSHGNMKWTGSAAYVLAIPLLLALAAAVRSRMGRAVTWALVALHLFAGSLHLWLYVTANQL
ncbi:hypothetical protein HQ535_12215 [bacterium]|nr:hypothetical protein [bacterium]